MKFGWLVLLFLMSCSRADMPKLEVYFCNPELCNEILSNRISEAKYNVHCAFYSLSSEEVIRALNSLPKCIEGRVVLEKQAEELTQPKQTAKGRGIMHNKFCVIDKAMVITGSYNPREASDYRDALLVVEDSRIAVQYETEFKELWYNKNVSYSNPNFNSDVTAYFCPEDDCNRIIIEELEKAEKSVNFAYYSFTSGELGLALVALSSRNISVSGIFEVSQISKFSQYHLLKNQGVNITVYCSAMVLHHKFIVIDNRTVITGSFNPTKRAQLFNDENILVIQDEKIAAKFNSEFKLLNAISECQTSKNI